MEVSSKKIFNLLCLYFLFFWVSVVLGARSVLISTVKRKENVTNGYIYTYIYVKKMFLYEWDRMLDEKGDLTHSIYRKVQPLISSSSIKNSIIVKIKLKNYPLSKCTKFYVFHLFL